MLLQLIHTYYGHVLTVVFVVYKNIVVLLEIYHSLS